VRTGTEKRRHGKAPVRKGAGTEKRRHRKAQAPKSAGTEKGPHGKGPARKRARTEKGRHGEGPPPCRPKHRQRYCAVSAAGWPTSLSRQRYSTVSVNPRACGVGTVTMTSPAAPGLTPGSA